MNKSLKKYLSLLLSIIMVFSVCNIGLLVFGETSDSQDCIVLQDGTTVGTVNLQNIVKTGVNINGRTACRVDPQEIDSGNGTFVWLNTDNQNGENLSSARALSLYVKNPMNVSFEFQLHRYMTIKKDDTVNYDIQGIVCPTYFVNSSTNEVQYVQGSAYTKVPANFDGYIVYDLDSADDKEAIQTIKDNGFNSLCLNIKNTEDMLTKCWYYSDIAVSTCNIRDRINNICGQSARYIINNADGTNDNTLKVVTSHGNLLQDGYISGVSPDGNAFGVTTSSNINGVDRNQENISVKTQSWIRNSLINAGISPKNALGISYYAKFSGTQTVNINIGLNSQQYDIRGAIFAIGFDGTARMFTNTVKLSNFEGIIYHVIDKVETSWGNDSLVSLSDFLSDSSLTPDGIQSINVFVYKPSKSDEGTSIILDNFAFHYDSFDIDTLLKSSNPVISNDTDSLLKASGNSIATITSYQDKYTNGLTYKADLNASTDKESSPFVFLNENDADSVYEPSKVNAISFKLRTSNFYGKTVRIVPAMVTSSNWFRGAITAVNYDGTVVSSKPAVTTGTNYIDVPSDFDGTIVMAFNGDQTIGYNGGREAYSFQKLYTSRSNKFEQLYITINPTNNGYLHESLIFDELRLVYDDADSYVQKLESNGSLNIANRKQLDDNVSIINNCSGNGKNSFIDSSLYTFSYTSNDSIDTKAVQVSLNENSHYGLIQNSVDVTGVDILSTKAIGLDLKVTNPLNKEISFSPFINSSNNNAIHGIIYLLSNDGSVATFNNKVKINKSFEGKMICMVDGDSAIQDGYGAGTNYSWYDFFENKTITNFNLYFEPSTYDSVADNNPTIVYDSISLYNSDSKIFEKIENGLNLINSGIDSNTIVGQLISGDSKSYSCSVVNNVNSPSGSAVEFSPLDNITPVTSNYSFNNNSKLSLSDIGNQEAISYWIKVPEGSTKTIRYPSFNGEKYTYSGSRIIVNAITGQIRYCSVGESVELSNFEGYIIYPLIDAKIRIDYNGETLGFKKFCQNTLSSLNTVYFYSYKENAIWYQSDMRFIPDIDEYLTNFGAIKNLGDINADNSINIIDLIRLKKYNDLDGISIAYQNADVDDNGKIEKESEFIALKKKLLGFDYRVEKKVDLDKVGVGVFHALPGDWDAVASNYGNEANVINTYITRDIYEIGQIRKTGGSAWIGLGTSYEGVQMFSGNELNDQWKNLLDQKISCIKKVLLWNTVAGFFTEELCRAVTPEQYSILTKYLSETYVGKRVFACLSETEINGGTINRIDSQGQSYEFTIEPANSTTYSYVTDIGYDNYDMFLTLENHTQLITNLKTHLGDKATTIKYWFFSRTYSPYTSAEDSDTPLYSDQELANNAAIYTTLLNDNSIIPEEQKGGIIYYTMKTFYHNNDDTTTTIYGLSDLVKKGYSSLASTIALTGNLYVGVK